MLSQSGLAYTWHASKDLTLEAWLGVFRPYLFPSRAKNVHVLLDFISGAQLQVALF